MEISAAALKKSRKYKDIKNNLLDIIAQNGAAQPAFTDLVDDYMTLWITKELLKIDIETEGVKSKYSNGGGQEGDRINPAVDSLRKTNTQMSRLLKELDITPEKVASLVPDEL